MKSARIFFLFFIFTAFHVQGELRLASFFGSHMVLQREVGVPVWGDASPGAEVTVSFRNHTLKTVADAEGYWRVDLPDLTPGEPAELRIASDGNVIVFTDVLVGDVWLAGGQSNMAWSVERSADAAGEIAAANFPHIRILQVEKTFSVEPREAVDAAWRICSPDSAANFPAVAYFFGRELHRELNVPIGLISASRGGSVAEAWMPREALENYPEILKGVREIREHWEKDPDLENTIQSQIEQFEEALQSLLNDPPAPDPSLFDPETVLTDAKPVFTGESFLEDTDGMVNLRRIFTLSTEQAQTEGAELVLSRINDFEITWINGTKIGRSGPELPMAARRMRGYPVPDGILRPGKNVVVLQLIDVQRIASFGDGVETPTLVWSNGPSLPLTGSWDIHTGVDLGARPEDLDRITRKSGTFLYNGMIAPLIPAAIKGVIWYQGESNVGRAVEYQRLFPDLIRTWRRLWNQGDFPFYFVQLANFRERADAPGESDWAELREAQRLSLSVPKTGMAVTLDIGEAGNIHPRNKQDVGKRLARLALGDTYSVEFPHPHISPLLREAVHEGDAIRIRFDHARGGLRTTDGAPPAAFALAGDDGIFHRAEARIEDGDILLSHSGVDTPRHLRYGWADNPDVNLINAAGLPASPFQVQLP